MKSIAAVLLGVLAWIGPVAPASESVSPQQKAESQLLRIHLGELEGHRRTNVDMLLANAQDGFVYVRDGKISRSDMPEMRQHFQQYFKNATYSVYEDIDPPIVRASMDGTMGWIISRTRARRSQKNNASGKSNTEEFVYAGIMTYELREGVWYRVANVSTFEPAVQ